MEVGTVGDPRGAWGDTPAETYIVPNRLPPERCPRGVVPVSPQPMMILQQLPWTTSALVPPAGPLHVREDLIDLMMIQNSQMHQVVMNSLAVSALTSFGFGPSAAAAQVMAMPLQTTEEEEAVVFHHHYIPYPSPAPVLAWPVPVQDRGPVAVRYLGTGSLAEDGEVSAVPPPPPPSATGTVGANVPPASEYYDVMAERL
ncbi:proline-rich protein 29 [Caloenas nicobarica]|uniref:proline-rich protein 29 n=1 Tax=Caloenas nicobarica TaxID=187106 RepID=UPI0032B8120C